MGDWLQDRCNAIQKAQQEHIQKSFGEDIEKARSGVYKPTKKNLKEGIAGHKYGSEKKEDVESVLLDMKSKVDKLFEESDKAFNDDKITREESKKKREEAKQLRDKYESLKEKYFNKYNLDPSDKSTFKFQLNPESY